MGNDFEGTLFVFAFKLPGGQVLAIRQLRWQSTECHEKHSEQRNAQKNIGANEEINGKQASSSNWRKIRTLVSGLVCYYSKVKIVDRTLAPTQYHNTSLDGQGSHISVPVVDVSSIGQKHAFACDQQWQLEEWCLPYNGPTWHDLAHAWTQKGGYDWQLGTSQTSGEHHRWLHHLGRCQPQLLLQPEH